MDVQMPVMDGLTATDKLRNEVSFEKPIIGVSANALKEDIYKALAIGMNDYLAKPILKVDLYQILIKWLK
jgi:CheY-like chemotaxis protein